MKLRWRILGWIVFAGLCAGIATAVFHFFRSQPRVLIQGSFDIVRLSDDGRRLLTRTRRGNELQVWDTESGAQLTCFLKGVAVTRRELSPDGNIVAALHDGAVSLIDWQRGEERTVRYGDAPLVSRVQFSSKGRWLFLRLPTEVVDVYVDVLE